MLFHSISIFIFHHNYHHQMIAVFNFLGVGVIKIFPTQITSKKVKSLL